MHFNINFTFCTLKDYNMQYYFAICLHTWLHNYLKSASEFLGEKGWMLVSARSQIMEDSRKFRLKKSILTILLYQDVPSFIKSFE